MRKTVSFLLTVAITMVCTAGIVRASSSSPDPVRAVPVAPSRVLGVDLSLGSCNSSPDNASEWTKFANCVTSNFSKVKNWAKTLDTCMKLWQIQSRSDDVYGNPPFDALPLDLSTGEGLSYATGGSFNYFMGWKQQAGCPTS